MSPEADALRSLMRLLLGVLVLVLILSVFAEFSRRTELDRRSIETAKEAKK